MHRKLLDNPILYKPNYMAIWTYLLLKANHKDTHMIWNNKKTTIKKGSLITSIRGISKLFRISTGSVTFILKYLISEHMIEQESNTKFTVLTIKNYGSYQDVEHKVENQRDTGETLAELNKNVKNEKNVKNNTNVLQTVAVYGNFEINEAISYMKEKLGIPLLDESEQVNRNYCNLLIKKFGGIEKVKLLIDATATHEFWSTRITSMKQLYYKGVNIISSGRDTKHAVTKL